MPMGMSTTMQPWFGTAGYTRGSSAGFDPNPTLGTGSTRRRRTSGRGGGSIVWMNPDYFRGEDANIPEPTFQPLPTMPDMPTVGSSQSYYRSPETQAHMERLIAEAAGIAPQQINAQRALEAQQLGEASKRISRTGASMGANKFARQGAWNKLASQLASERGTREADLLAQGQAMQSQAVGALTSAQMAARDQALSERGQEAAREAAIMQALLSRAGLDISQQSLLSGHRLGVEGLNQDYMTRLMSMANAGSAGGGSSGGFTIEGGGGGGGGGNGDMLEQAGIQRPNTYRSLGGGTTLTPYGAQTAARNQQILDLMSRRG